MISKIIRLSATPIRTCFHRQRRRGPKSNDHLDAVEPHNAVTFKRGGGDHAHPPSFPDGCSVDFDIQCESPLMLDCMTAQPLELHPRIIEIMENRLLPRD